MKRSTVLAFLGVSLFVPSVDAEVVRGQEVPTFELHVRPIFKAYCFDCHGEGDKLRGGLDLRLRSLVAKGGDTGPAIVPGDTGKSLLVERVRSGQMPPTKKKLTAEQVKLLERWIASGAIAARDEPREFPLGPQFTAEEKAFWAFQPIRKPDVPRAVDAGRVRTPVDAFLLVQLAPKKLTFSPEAHKRTLLRRATFDLLGLPPTPEEQAQFLADDKPDAYERLLDRLLVSPHYGERWGRHWLDVAGYADSEGYTSEDSVRPDAWKYRDYVIRSFNADKPFDQFIREQLAGDEMVPYPYRNLSAVDVEKLTATGFLRMAPDGTAIAPDQNTARNEVVAETIKIVSTSLLGLSVGCAECHNHRYDPIPQRDYYRFRALFEPALDWKNWRAPPARRVSLMSDADRARAGQIEQEALKIDAEREKKQGEYIERTFEAELKKLPEEVREPIRQSRKKMPAQRTAQENKLLTDYPSVSVTAGSLYLYDAKAAADLKAYVERATTVRKTKPVEEFLRTLSEVPGQVPTTFVFHRGDHAQPRQAVLPAELSILRPTGGDVLPKDPNRPTTGRRLAYATRLTDGTHPLTARVLVNRVWLHHFGRGILPTPGNFGMLGERPTHPELLDWLAADFMANGWKLKRLHKLLMTSTAYRQSSRRTRELDALDPDNRLLGRMSVRRLEAEAIRDGILAVSGKLNRKTFGPPVPVMEDEDGQFVIGIENKNGENRPGPVIPLHGEEFRRSVYIQVRRSRPLSVLDTFDLPALTPNCEARAASTVTPQALLFMNSDWMAEQANSLAELIRKESGTEPRGQVISAWRRAFATDPSEGQVKHALAFLAAQTATFQARPGKAGKPVDAAEAACLALASFCQALLSANAFLYVD
jgi:hypothetical protein